MPAESRVERLPRQSRWLLVALSTLLGLLTITGYWGVWTHDSINYDDPDYIFNNPNLNKGLTWSAVTWSFTRTHVSNWHPLTWLTHALDWTLYGDDAGGHHVTNLLLHIANSILLFHALRMLTGSVWRSVFVAALFAIHPLHVESVAWIAERKDVLSGFFFMLTLLAYAKYASDDRHQTSGGGRQRLWFCLTLTALACGLMSKAMLVTMPFVLLLLDVWPLKRAEITALNTQRSTLSRLIVEKIPPFALVVISSIITFVAQGEAVAAIDAIPIVPRLENAVVSYVAYLGQTFWPVNLAVFYPHPGNVPGVQLISALGLIAFVTFAVFRQAATRPYLGVGWFWFLGMLVPVIGIVQVGSQARADRYTYLPLIGIFVAGVWAITEVAGKRWRAALSAAGTLLIAVLAVLTHNQVRYWKNDDTLFRHATEVTKNNYVAWGGMGIEDLKQGRLESGMTNLFQALSLASEGNAANSIKYYIGVGLQLQGKGLDALPYLEQSVVSPHIRPERSYRLGLSLCDAGRLTEAEGLLTSAVEAHPENPEYQLGLAALMYQKGDVTTAERIYRDTSKQHPNTVVAQSSLATFLVLVKRDAEALPAFAAAVKLKPGDVGLRRKYAATLDRCNKTEEAIRQLEEAIRLNPEQVEAHFELAELFSKSGQSKQAAEHYEQVIKLDNNSLSALNNLAWLLATDKNDVVRNGKRAIELAEHACKITEWKAAVLMGTLAAAYAEAGRFDDAVKTAEKARDTALTAKQDEIAKRNQELVEQYRAAKPFREK